MNLFAEYLAKVIEIIDGLAHEGRLPSGLDAARVVVEPPRATSHGDLATNAAMVLAKDAGMKPRDLADMLVEELKKDPGVINALSTSG
jgi:arginyl-tRNA synthetase